MSRMAALLDTSLLAKRDTEPPRAAAPAPPSVGKTLARNMVWNWCGTAANMAAGFIVAPFLVHRLGELGYGLWILIASLTGYFDLLDLGVRGSLGRTIAFHQARGDRDGASAALSTGLALLLGGAVLVLAGTAGLLSFFVDLFDMPAGQVESTRLALLLIGINLALIFPFSAFESVLWAYQRFDLINGIDIPALLLRVGLTFWLVGSGGGLVTLAVITLTVTLASGLAKLVCAVRLDGGLRIRPGLLRVGAARNLFGFGIWCFLLAVARIATTQAGPLIIGSRLAVALVTPYSIAARLVSYAGTVLMTGTGVLTPLATALHAREKHAQQQQLFLQGGKYCLALALFFLGLFVFLGAPLIDLWIGRPLGDAALVLLLLALGEVGPQSQWVTFSTVLGMNRHRLWACMGLLEVVSVVVLALALLEPYGLPGVAVAIAMPGAVCRGLVPALYACRLLRVPLRQYARQALLPAVAAAAVPVAGLALATAWLIPADWLELCGYGAGYGLVFLGMGAIFLVGPARLKALGAWPPVPRGGGAVRT
jgi:O-antigen/teichoic acid export membrane protein